MWRGSRLDAAVRTRAGAQFIRVSRDLAPDVDSFGEALIQRAVHGNYDVVVPVSDYQTWLLANRRAELAGHVQHLLPDPTAFRLANDKSATLAHARSLGIATPQVWDWPGAPDISTLPAGIRYPVVVKARSGSGVGLGLRFASNAAQLRSAYLEIEDTTARVPTEDFSRPLITEFIPGFIHDACAVAGGGEVFNVLTQVRQLMSPITGGVGAVNITTNEPELRRLATQVLESLDWTGPAQIEFKFDQSDGQYKLIEINPRIWGTIDLSLRAGMNFAAQIRDLAIGRAVSRNQQYQVGLRYVFFSRAVSAYIQLARSHGVAALRDRGPYAGTTFGLDRMDPIPGAWELTATFARVARAALTYGRRELGRHRPEGHQSSPGPALPRDLVNTLDRAGDPGWA